MWGKTNLRTPLWWGLPAITHFRDRVDITKNFYVF